MVCAEREISIDDQRGPIAMPESRIDDFEASLAAMRVMVTAMIWIGIRDEHKLGDFVRQL